MIKILPERDKEKLKVLFKKHGLFISDDDMAVVCYDGQEAIGYALFSLDSERITLKILEPTDDLPLADGILRASLHVAAENGILAAFYDENAPKELFRRLSFIKNECKNELNINKLFSSCQNCGGN